MTLSQREREITHCTNKKICTFQGSNHGQFTQKIMQQIRLTQDSDTFSYSFQEKTGYNRLELQWDSPLDLTCVPRITLCSIQFDAFWADDYLLVPVYCNLIDSTTFNPLREVFRIKVDPLETIINESCSGEQTMNVLFSHLQNRIHAASSQVIGLFLHLSTKISSCSKISKTSQASV